MELFRFAGIMKCAFAFLFGLLSWLLPAHASASGVNCVNKIKSGSPLKSAFHNIFVEEKKYNDNPGIDNDGLDNDEPDAEALDNDDCNNENNNESTGRKRINLNFFHAADLRSKECIHTNTGNITASEHHIVLAGTSIIIFISQFRL